MAFSAGDKLGPYEILAKIGAGGMGEVYRAHDPRLRRDVAIKVSAERFSERFEREAHAVAALNHPNICAIYDVGPNYIVMEYIEGEAPKGPLALEEVLRIAHQIGDALAEAHSKGIVHRDLKPGNIKIKPDGTVKVLDFGLAKVGPTSTSAGLEAGATQSPTISMAATQAGVILGTAAYMSPEQARGKVVDKRADIWAFGVVLHELLTGRKLFQGEDISDTLAAVIKEEPKWEGVPPQVQRLLKSCLEKDPRNRLRDIGDAWRLLDDAPASAPSPSRLGWIAAGVSIIIAGVAFWASRRADPPADRPLVRLDVDLGPDVSLSQSPSGSRVIISPDGTRLAYYSGNPPRFFTRRLDQAKATELPGTEGDAPFFSPDGQWIGFTGRDGLKKISVEGDATIPLATQGGAGGSWGDDGNIIVAGAPGLLRIPSGGGSSVNVAKAEFFSYLPQLLLGGKAVLITTRREFANPDSVRIEAVSLADGSRKTVVQGGATGRYVASGHLLYTSKGTLFAVPFNLDRLETHGTPVPMVDDVAYVPFSGTAQYDVSRTGTLIYLRGGAAALTMSTVQWLDGSGRRNRWSRSLASTQLCVSHPTARN